MKKLFLGAFALCLGMVSSLNAQTLVTHDFNNGQLVPYETRKADQRARVYVTNGAVETHWEESKYNGTNSGRKAQFMPIGDPRFTQHIWMGLSLKVHSDYMRDNTNTEAGLMQIWGYNGRTGAANHMCMLKFDGRDGGGLVWQHRYNSVATKTNHLVKGNFPRNRFVDIVVHVQLKNVNDGIVQIWVDGDLVVNKTGQKIGWGDQDETGMINGTYCFGTSLGQYNYMENTSTEDTYNGRNTFNGHRNNETRTITYDNVALYTGSNGYDRVDPSDGENNDDDDDDDDNENNGGTSDFEPNTNRNYYIDNPRWEARLAANGGDRPYAKSPTANVGRLVQWQFSPAPTAGYYYIDGVGGGDNSRLCTDLTDYADVKSDSWGGSWTQWKITDAGDGLYHLTTLQGGNSRLQVDESSNIRMMTTDYTGSWTQFEISEVPSSREAKSLAELDSDFATVYPNPLATSTTVEGAEGSTISIYNMTGATVYEGVISSGSETLNLSGLASGIYYAKINGAGKLDIVKLIKQ